MMGLNLHNVVRGAITAVHPDIECVLYHAMGQRNIRGKVTPVYLEPISVMANFQPLDADKLTHAEGRNDTPASEQVFLYSTSPYVVGQYRWNARTGDILQYGEEYWLVIAVLEDWSIDGWANVAVHRQVTPPDFTASEWSEDYAGT